MVQVRPASLDDIPIMQDIEVDAGEMFRAIGLDRVADDPPPAVEVLADHVRSGTVWVAEIDRAVVGYAAASVVDAEGHLDQVSVRRSAAGRGIGSLLVGQVCEWASGQGLDAVTLTTFVNVPWNGPYYERLGFRVLPDAACGPELSAVRQAERDAGLDVLPRGAMRRHL